MRNFSFMLIFVGAVMMSSTAFAQPPRGGQGARGGQGDRDGQAEGRQRPRRGGQEGAARGGPSSRPSPLMAILDTNRDGSLSKKEIENAVVALKALDKNGDGSVDQSEMVPPRGGGPGAGGARGGATQRQYGNSGGNDRAKAMVDSVMARDKDGDGKVSKEEAGDRMGRFFGNMDGDKDGFLSKTEVEAMAKRMSRGGGGGGNRAPQPKSKENRPPFDDDGK